MATTKPAYAVLGGHHDHAQLARQWRGRESTVIDNATNLYLDAQVRVSLSVGSVPASAQVLVYAYGSEDGSLYPDTVTGSDAAVTLENPTVLRLAGIIPTRRAARSTSPM